VVLAGETFGTVDRGDEAGAGGVDVPDGADSGETGHMAGAVTG
jgi:hypothetical protein